MVPPIAGLSARISRKLIRTHPHSSPAEFHFGVRVFGGSEQEELYEKIWEPPILLLAPKYGISSVMHGIRTIVWDCACLRHGSPLGLEIKG
jgi:hypothetical protein